MTEVAVLENAKSRQEWTDTINSDWRKSIENVVQTGRDLIASKKELSHGEFGEMVKSDLDFGPRTAHNLMSIASNDFITNRTRGTDLLPASWTILRELSKIDKTDLAWAEERGLLAPDMSRGAARAIAKSFSADEGGIIPPPDRAERELPRPAEANKIARETGRVVHASDGRMYTGVSDEQHQAYQKKQRTVYQVADAIAVMTDMPDAAEWFGSMEFWWKRNFSATDAREAAAWLNSLADVLEDRDVQ